MNLFTARLTGKMLSTEQFEKHIQSTQARVARWKQIDQSSVLKEYLDLKQKIESPEFQAEKKELISRKYKDTRMAFPLYVRNRLCNLPVFPHCVHS